MNRNNKINILRIELMLQHIDHMYNSDHNNQLPIMNFNNLLPYNLSTNHNNNNHIINRHIFNRHINSKIINFNQQIDPTNNNNTIITTILNKILPILSFRINLSAQNTQIGKRTIGPLDDLRGKILSLNTTKKKKPKIAPLRIIILCICNSFH